ncbi:MAG: chemotaxis protein CheW, partial [Gemmatimonadetes bacterium]|nr:chemotaxis protein CheW [Gemmatimonadota bacterium]
VRSRVLTVLDLGAALGLGRSSSSPGHRVVVLEKDGRAVGLAVSGVGEIKTGSHEYTVIHVPELLAEWFG